MPAKPKTPVVVIGSGVIGLTTALSLQKTRRYAVTVVASDIADDLDGPHGISQDWASPFAGANWRPYSSKDNALLRAAEEEAYFKLRDIARESPEAGVRVVPIIDFGSGPSERELSFLNYAKNVRELDPRLWPKTASFGYTYDSLIVNVLQYLPWLTAQFRKLGGNVKRAHLDHILDALKHADGPCGVIVNCTAMGSLNLGGVKDSTVYPIRGQTILVRAPRVNFTTTLPSSEPEKATYVIPRGDETAILGGVFQRHNWDRSEDKQTTEEILRNCLSLCPQLLGRDYGHPQRSKIIRVNVGFRPSRRDGPRLEVEKLHDVVVLHSYGQTSFGYQTSWGYASAAVRMLDVALINNPRL
ncbi:FAD dependent oxidoreductase [Martensiomyces pterosporus]|nr:FAD dependent oxidoreductase [Martensiomyces pterosporus]